MCVPRHTRSRAPTASRRTRPRTRHTFSGLPLFSPHVSLPPRAPCRTDYENSIGIVDVSTNTFSFVPTSPAGATGTHKFAGAVALGAQIYFAPRDSDLFGVLSPAPPPHPPPLPPPHPPPPFPALPPSPLSPPHTPPPLPPSMLYTMLALLVSAFGLIGLLATLCALCRAHRLHKQHKARVRRHLVQGGTRQRTSCGGRALIDPAEPADNLSEPSEPSPAARSKGASADGFTSIMPFPPEEPGRGGCGCGFAGRARAGESNKPADGTPASTFSLARLRAAIDAGSTNVMTPPPHSTPSDVSQLDVPTHGASPPRAVIAGLAAARTPTGAGVLDTPTRLTTPRYRARSDGEEVRADADDGAGVCGGAGGGSAHGTPQRDTPTRGVLQQARHAAAAFRSPDAARIRLEEAAEAEPLSPDNPNGDDDDDDDEMLGGAVDLDDEEEEGEEAAVMEDLMREEEEQGAVASPRPPTSPKPPTSPRPLLVTSPRPPTNLLRDLIEDEGIEHETA